MFVNVYVLQCAQIVFIMQKATIDENKRLNPNIASIARRCFKGRNDWIIGGLSMAENKEKRLNIKDLNDVVTVDELASFMGATPRMVTNMVMAGDIKSFTFGRKRLFLKQDILSMIGYSEEKEAVAETEKSRAESQSGTIKSIPPLRHRPSFTEMGV